MVTCSFRWVLERGMQNYKNVARQRRQVVSFFAKQKRRQKAMTLHGAVVQRASTEYLITNGKARMLRRLIGNSYTYSRLGKQYVQHKPTAYLVHVPAIIKKAFCKSEGRKFMVPHTAFMFGELTVDQHIPSEAERRHQLKSKVLAFMEQHLDKLDGKLFYIMTAIQVYMTKTVHGRLMSKHH